MIKRKIAAAIAAAALLLSLASCGVKKVDFSYFDENFSPFFARNFQDLSVAALTGETILKKVLDDDGVAQPVWDAYSQGIGIADVTLDYSGKQTVATVKFGDDARFSDGSPITAKDAAFSIYVYAQADYDGWCTLKSSELDGLTNYRYASAAAESIAVTEADINAELAEPSDNTKKLIQQRIILPILREEYKWVTHLYGDKSYEGTELELHIKEHPEASDLFCYYYALDQSYTPSGDAEKVVSDVAAQYGNDYKTLELIYGADLSEMANDCARESIIRRQLEHTYAQKVTSIRGVEIIDDSTIKVTVNSIIPEQIEQVLGIYVTPFDYYGSGCEFDGTGFKIDLDSVAEKSGKPLGAGKYVFSSYKKGTGVLLKPNSYSKADVSGSVLLTETGSSNVPADNDYYITTENMFLTQKKS